MSFGEVEGWTTVYITGKRGFGEVIENRLDNHWVLGTPAFNDGALMFWLSDISELRTFKEAVGAKLILKYRLRFFMDVEEQLLSSITPDHGFSVMENVMISRIISRESTYLKNRKVPAATIGM